jgi:hypothetical protein
MSSRWDFLPASSAVVAKLDANASGLTRLPEGMVAPGCSDGMELSGAGDFLPASSAAAVGKAETLLTASLTRLPEGMDALDFRGRSLLWLGKCQPAAPPLLASWTLMAAA